LVANKLLAALGQPYSVDGHVVTCTPSLGIAMLIADQDDLEALIKQADAAMYQAKAAGRNRVRFFDPATQAAVQERTALIDALHQGLARHEFLLHYQVQVDAHGVATGAEALIRWNHPTRGLVSPAQFIPLAEETGLILPLGQWALHAACAQLVAWAQDTRKAHWSLAVNVSSLQFVQPDFVATVAQALQQSGARADLLKLELTESMLVTDVKQVIVRMNAVRALGASFSLDDFGTGYSSLSYLKSLPLAQLKIDQSFVSDLPTNDPNAAVIARSIVSLGHSLGLKVIAEGVETAGQRDYLAGLGCDAFQGYYFGHPGPAAALA
jgi:EAL domain-containing protein (putative c-di-GMP-specific phosphodiesterase class I)